MIPKLNRITGYENNLTTSGATACGEARPQLQVAMDSLDAAINAEGGLRDAVKRLHLRLEPVLNRSEANEMHRPPRGFDAPAAHALDLNAMAIEELTHSIETIIRRIEV